MALEGSAEQAGPPERPMILLPVAAAAVVAAVLSPRIPAMAERAEPEAPVLSSVRLVPSNLAQTIAAELERLAWLARVA